MNKSIILFSLFSLTLLNPNLSKFNTLSNIFTDWYSKEEIKEIFLKFNNYLNNEGKMLVSYLYDTNADTIYDSKWADIYNLELMFQIFSEYNFKLHTFVGVDGLKWEDPNFKKDSVLIYTKRK